MRAIISLVTALALYGCTDPLLLMPPEDYLKFVAAQSKPVRWEMPDLPDVTPPTRLAFAGSGNNRQPFDPARLRTTASSKTR